MPLTVLSIVGTLYAVLLGLIVVDAMVRFERAMDESQQESNSLSDIVLLADRFPDPHRSRLQNLCRTYAQEVVFPLVLEQSRQLWNLRRDRSNSVQFAIPAVEWVALFVGALDIGIFEGQFQSGPAHDGEDHGGPR